MKTLRGWMTLVVGLCALVWMPFVWASGHTAAPDLFASMTPAEHLLAHMKEMWGAMFRLDFAALQANAVCMSDPFYKMLWMHGWWISALVAALVIVAACTYLARLLARHRLTARCGLAH